MIDQTHSAFLRGLLFPKAGIVKVFVDPVDDKECGVLANLTAAETPVLACSRALPPTGRSDSEFLQGSCASLQAEEDQTAANKDEGRWLWNDGLCCCAF